MLQLKKYLHQSIVAIHRGLVSNFRESVGLHHGASLQEPGLHLDRIPIVTMLQIFVFCNGTV